MNFIFLIVGTACAILLAGEVTAKTPVSAMMVGISWFFALAMAMWTLLEAWLLFQENK